MKKSTKAAKKGIKTKRTLIVPLTDEQLEERASRASGNERETLDGILQRTREDPKKRDLYTLYAVSFRESGSEIGSLYIGEPSGKFGATLYMSFVDDIAQDIVNEAITAFTGWYLGTEDGWYLEAPSDCPEEQYISAGFKKDEGSHPYMLREKTSWMAIYMCLGMSCGMCLGMTNDNTSLGMCIGIAIGLAIGISMDNQAKKKAAEADEERLKRQ